ncbi:sugar phosphate isomerase/epimerase [Acuticoccus sediminis]|uniref:Sugar phosphate isomerase/epimerase n=1 Tax=Acuticoccus sediminis TaxID=2184697 RepID=A0A8B2NV30_9HYPH|nr:sugar phosphate isomerase/epimerase family protein [Acuticoccus sediminis]RAI02168.1 sugar phosphate isomerase/epimerase [Acuticoccus sediminis]
MKISLCNEVLRERPFAEQCALAAALGYDGLEVAPFTLSDDPARIPAAERARLKRLAADAGVPVTGLHWLLSAPAGLSITNGGADVVARTRAHILSMVELCADLGGTVLVHGSPGQRQLADAPSPEAGRMVAADHFASAGDAAERAGVLYLVEPLAPSLTDYINTIEEAARVVESVASPGLATMLDCAAVAGGECESAAILAERWLPSGVLRHIHLNDRALGGPGQGEDRFMPLLAALARGGYDGIAAIEPFIYSPDGPTCAARSIGYVRGLIETLGDAS